MTGYIAIDCGKYNTKVDAFNPETQQEPKLRYRIKISDGTFDDDMFDKGTFIVQIDGGPVYKVGNDAKTETLKLLIMESDSSHVAFEFCSFASISYFLVMLKNIICIVV